MPQLLRIGMLVVAFSVGLAADVLVLRDGSRVQGELLSVRNGVVEFEERRGGRARTMRLERDEVVRIELGNDTSSDNRGFSSNRNSNSDSYSNNSSDGRPAGMRERTVTVSADVACNDSGIDVRSGQSVYFEATGNVRWGRDRRDGPAGENNSPSNPGRPMPNRPAAALIGKIGDSSSDYFFIGGETGAARMRSSGRLYLCVNDDVLADNTGNFRVVVYY